MFLSKSNWIHTAIDWFVYLCDQINVIPLYGNWYNNCVELFFPFIWWRLFFFWVFSRSLVIWKKFQNLWIKRVYFYAIRYWSTFIRNTLEIPQIWKFTINNSNSFLENERKKLNEKKNTILVTTQRQKIGWDFFLLQRLSVIICC